MATLALSPPDPRCEETAAKIRLLIVDDSAVARAVLARMISGSPAFEVVAAVPSATEALSCLRRTRVDVILLDIEMPGRSGIAALPEIIAAADGAKVLIVSALAEDGAAATVEALTLGAADTLAKPGKGAFGGRFAQVLCERLARLARADAGVSTRGRAAALAPPVRPQKSLAGPVECIAIGASTGGLHALAELFRALPGAMDAPVLITQHLPAVFMPYFAEQMAAQSGRKAVVAREGMTLQPGRLHIAPGDAHLGLERHGERAVVALSQRRAGSGCLPSVDPMFDAVATVFGAGAVGVVLTGMGRDGAEGARKLAASGAELLAQDVESSVVWGMPGAITKAGLATAVLPPPEIARWIAGRGR